jgi:chromosome segregation ATPase
LKDELVSEKRSKDSVIETEHGKIDSMQKQIEALKQYVSQADARLVEADQHYKESQRRLAVAEGRIQTQKLEMDAAEMKYQREMRDVERERARIVSPGYDNRQNNA